MNLIDKFKNRETKKKLREENARLREKIDDLQNSAKPNICIKTLKNIHQVEERVAVPMDYADAADEIVKNKLARDLVDRLIPFVEYSVENTFYGERTYTANLYIATGDRNGF